MATKSKIKVIYDARWILVENRFDGVSRYTHELAWAMSRRSELDITWLVHDRRQLAKLPPGNHIYANNPLNVLKEFFALPRLLNRQPVDVVYNPFFAMGTWHHRYKLVLTIHDMIYFRFRTPPHWYPWWIRLGWWLAHSSYLPLRRQLNAADVVATVSDTAREELLEAHITTRDIVTVSNAVNDSFIDTTERDHHASQSIVYMGAFTPYKNVECLIDALALLPDMTLHLCSKIPPTRHHSLAEYIAHTGVEGRVVLHDGTTDEKYKSLLDTARCAVSASRIEGFGLPLIEAQQRGVPFVAADTPIFREIGQDSVLYFDPDSPEQLAECILRLGGEITSRDMIARGRDNAARYTWDASAAVAAQVCKQLHK